MKYFKKTIFLSNKIDNNIKTIATLTLEKKNNSIFGTIKAFNNIPSGNLLLGIKSGEKVIKQNVSFNNNLYNFILSENVDIEQNLGCVLLEVNDNKLSPIIWGSEKSDNSKTHIISNLKTNFEKLNNKTKINANISKAPILDNTKTESILSCETSNIFSRNHIDTHDICLHLNNNNEEDFSSTAMACCSALFESDDEEIEEIIDEELNKEGEAIHNFYNMIAEQLDELFDKYPREENLEILINNSRWVKINAENSRHYVVGIIYENNDIKYITYGVPGSYNSEPPVELRGYSQWLPVDTKDPYNKGYWVMYQDANTGENILIN